MIAASEKLACIARHPVVVGGSWPFSTIRLLVWLPPTYNASQPVQLKTTTLEETHFATHPSAKLGSLSKYTAAIIIGSTHNDGR